MSAIPERESSASEGDGGCGAYSGPASSDSKRSTGRGPMCESQWPPGNGKVASLGREACQADKQGERDRWVVLGLKQHE